MKITIQENERVFDTVAAWRVIDQLKAKPDSVIGLSTGRTTKNMHLEIADTYKQSPFDVSQATFFGVDEVVNVPRTYAGACYTMLKTECIDDLGIDEDHFLMLPTVSDDFEGECREFERQLELRGGIDLLILGLGENGHLGFNQPGTAFGQTTWVTKMDVELEQRIRRETNTPPQVTLGGVTLGLKNMMHARRIILVAKGSRKPQIVRQMITGPVTPDVPASILQLHPNCEVLLDREAAAEIV